jgi:hypothetical protein
MNFHGIFPIYNSKWGVKMPKISVSKIIPLLRYSNYKRSYLGWKMKVAPPVLID